jgi:hypothetical protein
MADPLCQELTEDSASGLSRRGSVPEHFGLPLGDPAWLFRGAVRGASREQAAVRPTEVSRPLASFCRETLIFSRNFDRAVEISMV